MAKPDEGEEPPRAAPSRIPAIIVGVLVGPGAGHFLAGLSRRGVVFALGYIALFVIASVAVARAPSTLTIALYALPFVLHLVSVADLVRIPKERLQRVQGKALLQIGALVVAGIFLRNGMHNHAVVLRQVTTGSMSPTLAAGDFLLVTKSGPPPGPGDIVPFPNPEKPEEIFVKRIVGVAGDTIEQRGNVLSVNGEPVRRCVVGKVDGGLLALERLGNATFLTVDTERLSEELRTWTVKPGEVFVVGDNRANSHDSRMWFEGKGGGVPTASIVGRATFRVVRAGKLAFGPLDELALPSGADGLADRFAACRTELGG